MAPVEFHRYTDARGDTIIYKFDLEIARKPNPTWPNDSAVTVYHQYKINKPITVNHHSDLLPLDCAMYRWRNDKQMLQPIIGMVMHKETDVGLDGRGVPMSTQYIWKGWGYGEGYRRGWAKLQAQLMGGRRVTCVSQEFSDQQLADMTGMRALPRFRPEAVVSVEAKERKDSKDLQNVQDVKDLCRQRDGQSLTVIDGTATSHKGNKFKVLANMAEGPQMPESSDAQRYESLSEDQWPFLHAQVHPAKHSNQICQDQSLSKAQRNNRRKREAKKRHNQVDLTDRPTQNSTPADRREPLDALVQMKELQQALRGASMSQLIQEIAKKQLDMRGIAQGTFSLEDVKNDAQRGSFIQWRSDQQQSAPSEWKEAEEGLDGK